MKLTSIGIVHSPYKTTAEAPPQGKDEISEIEIHGKYADGLTDLDGFSHIHVFYWFHKSKTFSLSVNTPHDLQPHGLFATRTPNRPNPLGYSAVQLLKVTKNVLTVRGLEAIEGTPVIDIKPYIPETDAKPTATSGWIEGKLSKTKRPRR